LFLIPADSNDHAKEFKILYNELEEYNPELLDKKIILAISKSEMLDDELKGEIEATLPKKVPHIFISSVANINIDKLKDMLWQALTSE
jgi:GTP-binding protein